MTGNYGGDFAAANAAVKQAFPKDGFPGHNDPRVKGTWNHKSFNPETQEFIMELVDAADHRAKSHTGAMNEYLEWVAKVVSSGDAKNLDEKGATMLLKTLKDSDLGPRVRNKLGKYAYLAEDVADFTIKKLRNNGYRVIINSATGEVTEIAAKKVGRQLVGKVVRFGGKSLPAVFILWSADEALADTGSPVEASKAAVRELVMADMVEGVFTVTVVRGADKLGEWLIDPGDKLREKYSKLPEEQRRLMLEAIENALNQKSYLELEEYFQGKEVPENSFWSELWEGIDGGWGK